MTARVGAKAVGGCTWLAISGQCGLYSEAAMAISAAQLWAVAVRHG